MATDAPPLLALEGLKVAYGGIQAVKGIDLVVGEGELVCLIGANGAGKTTTLKGVTGLQPVSGGSVRYGGNDVTGPRAADGAEGVRDRARGELRGRHDPADRAERQARARGEPPRLRDGVRRDHARRRREGAAARRQGARRVSRRRGLTSPAHSPGTPRRCACGSAARRRTQCSPRSRSW